MSCHRAWMAIGCSLLVSACSATNEVNDITNLQPGSPIAGIPFRLADRYRVHVLQLQPDGSYKDVFVTTQDMPDQEHIFAVNFKGNALSDHEFKVELNDDNTLKTTHLKSTQHVTDTVGAVADQAGTVNTAIQTRNTADYTALQTCRTQVDALKSAQGAARVAQATYDATLTQAGATQVQIETAAATLADANQKVATQTILIAHSPPCPDN